MAYVLGAAQPYPQATRALLMNHYVQMESLANLRDQGHLVQFSPFISPSNLSKFGLGEEREYGISGPEDIIDAIVELPKNGFFPYLSVDEFFIPCRSAYRKSHTPHDILVLCSNAQAKIAIVIGYCEDGRYKRTECTFDALTKAVLCGKPNRPSRFAVVGFRFSPSARTNIDTNLLAKQLDAFLECRSVSGKTTTVITPNNSFGIAVFDNLSQYIKGQASHRYFDRRGFSIVLDHARLMLYRAQELSHSTASTITLAQCRTTLALAHRLYLLACLPPGRVSANSTDFMIHLCGELREESERSAYSIRGALEF
jgi:hypothetical protein